MGYIDNLMRKSDARQRKTITSKWEVSAGNMWPRFAVVANGEVVCRCESENMANHIVKLHNAAYKPARKPVAKKKPVKAKK